MQKRDLIQANASLENLRQNLDMKDIAKEILLEENYNKFIRSYKFQFVVLKIQLNNPSKNRCYMEANKPCNSGFSLPFFATVYKGNIIKNLIMDCQSYTKYRPNETTGGIFVPWRRKEELPTGA